MKQWLNAISVAKKKQAMISTIERTEKGLQIVESAKAVTSAIYAKIQSINQSFMMKSWHCVVVRKGASYVKKLEIRHQKRHQRSLEEKRHLKCTLKRKRL